MDKFVASWAPVAQWPDSYRITAARARDIILMPATQQPFDQWQRVFEGVSSGRRLDSVPRETMISVAKGDRVMNIDQNPPKIWNAELMAGTLLHRLYRQHKVDPHGAFHDSPASRDEVLNAFLDLYMAMKKSHPPTKRLKCTLFRAIFPDVQTWSTRQLAQPDSSAARNDNSRRERGEAFGLHNVDWEYDGLEAADGMDIDTPYDPNQPIAPDTNVHELNQQQTALRDRLMCYPPVEKRDRLARDVLAAFQPVAPSDASSGLPNIWSEGISLEEACRELGIENKEPYHLPGTRRSQPLYWLQVRCVAHVKRCLLQLGRAAILDYPGCGKTRETLLSLEMALAAAEGVKKPSLIVVSSAAVGEQLIGEGPACSNALCFVAFGDGFPGKYRAEYVVHCI
ncbi:uncharacterized protein BKA78DRAFT_292064 [Phyllosticta capitalensis]|uniref:uncharacterized protein n=1 Tax=Phyllosticta capitalensis TaxID=121624 RepID=UPI003131D04E